MIKAISIAFFLILIAFSLWLFWPFGAIPSNEFVKPELHVYGVFDEKPSIIGIQPVMEAADFSSTERYEAKLRKYLERAKVAGHLQPGSVVLFPEYIGTWLVAVNERRGVFASSSITGAMARLMGYRPFQFLTHWMQSDEADRTKAALFRMKAEQMATAYQLAFGNLAAEFECYIFAGSIVLPGASYSNGKLEISPSAPLENISLVFDPKGKLLPDFIRKVYPIEEELSFTSASGVDQLPVFDLPQGAVASVICADSWYPDIYDHLSSQKVEVLLVPSFSSPGDMWLAPWGGYNGSAMPADVASADVSNLSEKAAWERYALAGRGPLAGITHGINVFLRGQLWDMSSGGDAFVIYDSQSYSIDDSGTGLVVVLYP